MSGIITLMRKSAHLPFTETTISESMNNCMKCTYIDMPMPASEEVSKAEANGGPIAIAQPLAKGRLGSGFQIPSQRHLPTASKDTIITPRGTNTVQADHDMASKAHYNSQTDKSVETPGNDSPPHEVDGLQEYKEDSFGGSDTGTNEKPQFRYVFPCKLHQLFAERNNYPEEISTSENDSTSESEFEDDQTSEGDSSYIEERFSENDWTTEEEWTSESESEDNQMFEGDSSDIDESLSENDWTTEEEWTTDNDEPAIISPQLNMLRTTPLLRKYPHESESDPDIPETPKPDRTERDNPNPRREATTTAQHNPQQGSLFSEIIAGLKSLNESNVPNTGLTQEQHMPLPQTMPDDEKDHQSKHKQEETLMNVGTTKTVRHREQPKYLPNIQTNPFQPEYNGSQGPPNTSGDSQHKMLEVTHQQPINSYNVRDRPSTNDWPPLPQSPNTPIPNRVKMELIKAGLLLEGNISTEFNYYNELHKNRYIQIMKAKVIVRYHTTFNHDESKRDWEKTVDEISEINSDIKDSYRKLCKLYKTAIKDDEVDDDVPMPTFGQLDQVKGWHILPRFDNITTGHKQESHTNVYFCATIYQYWCKIIQYVSTQGISEKGTKTILGLSLEQEPYDIFSRNIDKPVKEIILQLKERFGSFPTQADYEDQLASFKREIEEPISIAMNRFEFIIRNVYKGEYDLPKIVELRCRNEVKHIARPHAQEVLARKEAEEGNQPFTYQRRLKIIKDEERLIEQSKRVAEIMGQQAL